MYVNYFERDAYLLQTSVTRMRKEKCVFTTTK